MQSPDKGIKSSTYPRTMFEVCDVPIPLKDEIAVLTLRLWGMIPERHCLLD